MATSTIGRRDMPLVNLQSLSRLKSFEQLRYLGQVKKTITRSKFAPGSVWDPNGSPKMKTNPSHNQKN